MLFDFAGLAPNNCCKLLVATVTPRPIAWVARQDLAGVPNAAPCSFFNAMSGYPLMVVFGTGGREQGTRRTPATTYAATASLWSTWWTRPRPMP